LKERDVLGRRYGIPLGPNSISFEGAVQTFLERGGLQLGSLSRTDDRVFFTLANALTVPATIAYFVHAGQLQRPATQRTDSLVRLDAAEETRVVVPLPRSARGASAFTFYAMVVEPTGVDGFDMATLGAEE
jgi:hypothetical protein